MIQTPKPRKLQLKNVFEYHYTPEEGVQADDIKAEAQKISNLVAKKGWFGTVQISVDLITRPHACKYTWIGHKVQCDLTEEDSVDTAEVPDSFNNFSIFVQKYPAPINLNGDDKYNNCVYNAIKKVIGDKIPWKQPSILKQKLGLKFDEKIDVPKYIGQIEADLKHHKVNITGDIIYVSPKKCQLEINLKSIKGHMKPNFSIIKHDVKGVSFAERIPLLYTRLKGGKKIIYDPTQDKERDLLDSEYLEIYKNPKTSKFMLIPTIKRKVEKTLKQQYEEYMTDANSIKEYFEMKSNEKAYHENLLINILKTGTDSNTVIKLVMDSTRDILCDKIGQAEAEYLEASTTGPMTFAEPFKGEIYHYDIKSCYPSILNSVKTFPYKKGIFKLIDKLEDDLKLEYGLYHCIITNTCPKLFRTNYCDWYTHIDIHRARDLKLKIELVQDKQVNALVYPRESRLNGSQMFGRMIKLLTAMKSKGVGGDRISRALKMIWGSLSSKKSKTITVGTYNPKEKIIELPENMEIYSKKRLNDELVIIEYFDRDDRYVTPFARIKPFVLAFGRSMVSRYMEPDVKNVKRCNSDGYYVTKQLDVKTGTKAGDLVYKGCCKKGIIMATNNFVGEFKI